MHYRTSLLAEIQIVQSKIFLLASSKIVQLFLFLEGFVISFFFKEPKTDKDDDNCKRINELLNNPSSAVQSSLERPDQDLQTILSSMSQSQLMQLFGGANQISGLSSLLGSMRFGFSGFLYLWS